MTSQLFKIVERERDPQTVLETIAVLIAGAERNYPVEEAVKTHFNKSFESDGRRWGEHQGTIEDIRLQREALDRGFRVTFSYDEYARGCHMGSTRYVTFIPDNLVTLWEAWQDEDQGFAIQDEGSAVDTYEAFQSALMEHTKERIESIRRDIKETARQEEADRVAQANATYELLGNWHNGETEARYLELANSSKAGTATDEEIDGFLTKLLDEAPTDVVLGYARRILVVDKMRFNPSKSVAWPRIQKMYVNLLV